MYNVNFVSDDIVSAMGYAVPFKEMAGKTITAVGACIMDVDDHEITFIKGDDGEYYSGSSQEIHESAVKNVYRRNGKWTEKPGGFQIYS